MNAYLKKDVLATTERRKTEAELHKRIMSEDADRSKVRAAWLEYYIKKASHEEMYKAELLQELRKGREILEQIVSLLRVFLCFLLGKDFGELQLTLQEVEQQIGTNPSFRPPPKKRCREEQETPTLERSLLRSFSSSSLLTILICIIFFFCLL